MPTVTTDNERITETSILCDGDGCSARLRLTQSSPASHGLDSEHFTYAIELAAAALGWTSTTCPKHRRDPVEPA
jgi:hypothetical protein